ARRELLATWPASKVRPADDAAPWRWETGTLNHEGLAGLVAAVEYLARLVPVPPEPRAALAVGVDAIARHEQAVAARFLEGTREIGGVRLYGIADPDRVTERTPTFSLTIDGVPPRAAASRLADRGVFVWDGNYYALAIMERLGLEASGGAVRVGL